MARARSRLAGRAAATAGAPRMARNWRRLTVVTMPPTGSGSGKIRDGHRIGARWTGHVLRSIEVLRACGQRRADGFSRLSCLSMSTPENLPQLRVSDAERDAVVARLNDATGEGRLTIEEFSERVSAALAARTRGDLDVLLADLPAHPSTQPRPTPVPGPRVVEITPIGSVKRGGNWRIDRDMELGTIVGSV